MIESFKKELVKALQPIARVFQFKAPSDFNEKECIVYDFLEPSNLLTDDRIIVSSLYPFSIRYYVEKENEQKMLSVLRVLEQLDGVYCETPYFTLDTQEEYVYLFSCEKVVYRQ